MCEKETFSPYQGTDGLVEFYGRNFLRARVYSVISISNSFNPLIRIYETCGEGEEEMMQQKKHEEDEEVLMKV